MSEAIKPGLYTDGKRVVLCRNVWKGRVDYVRAMPFHRLPCTATLQVFKEKYPLRVVGVEKTHDTT